MLKSFLEPIGNIMGTRKRRTPFANVAGIIDRYHWEHVGEHMLKFGIMLGSLVGTHC
jgi:hypothetical protein